MREASPLKEFARYTSLNVLGMIGLSCYILADTFFVSLGLGADGLAALNLAIPIYSFINGSGLMIGMGGGTRYSILQSQGNRREANRRLHPRAVPGGGAGLPFCGGGPALCRGHCALVRRHGERVHHEPHLPAGNPSICPCVLDEQRAAVLCAQRRRASALHGGHDGGQPFQRGAGLGVHLPLRHGDLRGGIRHRTGAHHQHGHPLPPFPPTENNQFQPVACRPQGAAGPRILSSGVPSLVTEVSSGIVIIVFNALILGLEGNTGVAAYGVIANLSLVVIAIYTGIAQGIQPILSRSYGGGDRDRLSATLRYAMIAMLGVSVAIYGAVLTFAPQIAAAFNSEGKPHPAGHRRPRAAAVLHRLPLCRVQRSALDVLHLYGPALARPCHFPAAGVFPHHPRGPSAGCCGADGGHLAGLSCHGMFGGAAGGGAVPPQPEETRTCLKGAPFSGASFIPAAGR